MSFSLEQVKADFDELRQNPLLNKTYISIMERAFEEIAILQAQIFELQNTIKFYVLTERLDNLEKRVEELEQQQNIDEMMRILGDVLWRQGFLEKFMIEELEKQQ